MSLQSWGHAWRLRSQVQDSVSRALWQKELITSLVLSPPGSGSAAPTEEALWGSPQPPCHQPLCLILSSIFQVRVTIRLPVSGSDVLYVPGKEPPAVSPEPGWQTATWGAVCVVADASGTATD